jgi:hypothetical protein
MVALLPHLEQGPLFEKFDVKKSYADNLTPAETQLPVYFCPSGIETGPVTYYVAMSGISKDSATQPTGAIGNGFMGYDRLTSMRMITDGTSNTIAVMETHSNVGPWARGGASTLRGFDPAVPLDPPPASGHANGLHVGMADGTVRFIRSSFDPHKLAAAITIADGDQADLD